jgi:hypothetical protein
LLQLLQLAMHAIQTAPPLEFVRRKKVGRHEVQTGPIGGLSVQV